MEIPRGQYIKNVLIAIDQLFNAVIGGYCDESLPPPRLALGFGRRRFMAAQAH